MRRKITSKKFNIYFPAQLKLTTFYMSINSQTRQNIIISNCINHGTLLRKLV